VPSRKPTPVKETIAWVPSPWWWVISRVSSAINTRGEGGPLTSVGGLGKDILGRCRLGNQDGAAGGLAGFQGLVGEDGISQRIDLVDMGLEHAFFDQIEELIGGG